MAIDITRPTAHDALSLEELALYHLMMDYRATLGLGAIPLSKGLTATAGRHVLDTRENIWAANLVLPAGANLHSWSDAPYFGDHRAPQVMWDAPERIGTGYTGNGYEISAAGYGSIAAALAGWQSSPGHNAVIAQTGSWSTPFLAIGIGVETTAGAGPFGGRIYHVWFGHQADPTGVPDILGTAAADNARATAFADRIFGFGGNDTLLGEGGADLLDGGLGIDSLVGGAGNDVYRVNSALDRVVELPGGGTDHVLTTASIVLAAEVEKATVVGLAAANVTGNVLANTLVGNVAANRLVGFHGNDTLLGAGGDDTLVGGLGLDRLVGGAGADHFRFGGSTHGVDRIVDFTAEDVIEISSAGFGGGLALGALDAARFSLNAPSGSLPQLVYMTATGVLRWDGDGAGGAPSVPIAVLVGAPVLGAGDVMVIA